MPATYLFDFPVVTLQKICLSVFLYFSAPKPWDAWPVELPAAESLGDHYELTTLYKELNDPAFLSSMAKECRQVRI